MPVLPPLPVFLQPSHFAKRSSDTGNTGKKGEGPPSYYLLPDRNWQKCVLIVAQKLALIPIYSRLPFLKNIVWKYSDYSCRRKTGVHVPIYSAATLLQLGEGYFFERFATHRCRAGTA